MKYDWNKVYDLLERLVDAELADHGAHNEAARRVKLDLLKREIQSARHPGVYVLGSDGPVCRAGSRWVSRGDGLDPATAEDFKIQLDKHVYTSFSGVDMNVYVAKDKEIIQLGNVQGISVARWPFVNSELLNWRGLEWGGSMIMLLFDRTVIKPEDHFDFMALQAINEYGHCMWMGVTDVKILGYGTGVSIDDITTDENLEYGANGYTGWLEGLAVRRETKEEAMGSPQEAGRGPLMLTDTAEEAMGLKGLQHGIRILSGWRERWDQIKEETARRWREEESEGPEEGEEEDEPHDGDELPSDG
jgi:hypothetical protein